MARHGGDKAQRPSSLAEIAALMFDDEVFPPNFPEQNNLKAR